MSGGGDQSSASIPLPIYGDRIRTKRDTNVVSELEMINNRPTPDRVENDSFECDPEPIDVGHGDVLIAAITSCTNTSNPSVMLAAGIVAKKAAERGMKVPSYVKTSLAAPASYWKDVAAVSGRFNLMAARPA